MATGVHLDAKAVAQISKQGAKSPMANRSNELEDQSEVDPRSFLSYVLDCLAGLDGVEDRKRGSESRISDELIETCKETNPDRVVKSSSVLELAMAPKQRVLIVDDERSIADTLALILNAIGFETKAFYKGEMALEAAAQFRPDIVISDVIMGGINGIEVAILISKMLPKCKVILFSGQASTADLVTQAMSEGHKFEILAKPVHPEVLIDRIRRLAPSASA
jgi:CheY-like chemotaxis protein